jgi:hypothetical protein
MHVAARLHMNRWRRARVCNGTATRPPRRGQQGCNLLAAGRKRVADGGSNGPQQMAQEQVLQQHRQAAAAAARRAPLPRDHAGTATAATHHSHGTGCQRRYLHAEASHSMARGGQQQPSVTAGHERDPPPPPPHTTAANQPKRHTTPSSNTKQGTEYTLCCHCKHSHTAQKAAQEHTARHGTGPWCVDRASSKPRCAAVCSRRAAQSCPCPAFLCNCARWLQASDNALGQQR